MFRATFVRIREACDVPCRSTLGPTPHTAVEGIGVWCVSSSFIHIIVVVIINNNNIFFDILKLGYYYMMIFFNVVLFVCCLLLNM